MKSLAFIAIVFVFFSCTRKTPPDEPDPAIANTVSVLIDGKTYRAPITTQQYSYTGAAFLYITAASSEIEVTIQAKSFLHNYGAGEYFLYCCENSILEKFTGGQLYDGIENGMVNSNLSEKGRLTVTNTDSKGYQGTFTFVGKNSNGEEKSFAGTFKVVY